MTEKIKFTITLTLECNGESYTHSSETVLLTSDLGTPLIECITLTSLREFMKDARRKMESLKNA